MKPNPNAMAAGPAHRGLEGARFNISPRRFALQPHAQRPDDSASDSVRGPNQGSLDISRRSRRAVSGRLEVRGSKRRRGSSGRRTAPLPAGRSRSTRRAASSAPSSALATRRIIARFSVEYVRAACPEALAAASMVESYRFPSGASSDGRAGDLLRTSGCSAWRRRRRSASERTRLGSVFCYQSAA